jgi:hypothetical protein
MAEIYIPTLHSFAMENIFTGSFQGLRFKITPNVVKLTQKEVDFSQSSMTAEIWRGLFCYEKSTVEETKTFPLSAEGRREMISWLEKKA